MTKVIDSLQSFQSIESHTVLIKKKGNEKVII